MALKSVPARLGTAPARIGRAPESEVQRHRRRDAEIEQRRWYKTARWQKLKHRIHVRDGFVCQQTGELCLGKHPAPDSPVADHKVPPRGDPVLFWDEDNVQTVTKAYHDREKQRLERAGRA